MSFNPQYSNWNPLQLVTAAEMKSYSLDIYQRLAGMNTIKPIILSGFVPSVDNTGLVTVTAGSAVGQNFSQSDNASLPGNGLQSIVENPSSSTVNVTAMGAEYGLVVLRLTVTAIVSTPNYAITSTLTYLAGTTTAYPAIGAHDIVVCGVITSTGPSFAIDLSPRVTDQVSYFQATQGQEYFTNCNLALWNLGTGPFSSQGDVWIPTANNWYISTTSVASGITATQVALNSAERALMPNSPLYGITVARAAADAASGVVDTITRLVSPSYALNGKYVCRSFWAAATATDDLVVIPTLGYNPQQSTLIAVNQSQTPITIIADGTYRLYTLSWFIPELTDAPGTDDDDYIAFSLNVTNINQIYSLSMTEDHNLSGNFYVTPAANPINSNLVKTGKVELDYFDVDQDGYVLMDDGTIGSATSGATTFAGVQASELYTLFWNNILDAYCPVTGGRGASAAADFAADKAMVLPATLGRALCAVGQPQVTQIFTAAANVLTVVHVDGVMWAGTPVTVSNTGGALPSPLLPATTYYAIPLSSTTISLADSIADAIAGNVITLTDAGSGTNIIVAGYVPFSPSLGQPFGEVNHIQIETEIGTHTHNPSLGGSLVVDLNPDGDFGGGGLIAKGGSALTSTGNSSPMNIMQPSTSLSVRVKL